MFTTAAAQAQSIPLITRAEVDTDSLALSIQGTSFMTNPLPRVLLGTALGGFQELHVTQATTTTITAIMTTLVPGTYRLVVQFGTRGFPIATLDVTLGATGPQGPQGLPGIPGPPGPDQSGRIAELESQITALSADVAALKALLQHFSRSGNDVIIEGANLHVRSGSGSTDGPINGLGNLVVGYNELRGSNDVRSGSHNVIVGSRNNYSSYGGFVAGFENAVSAAFANVVGGRHNDERSSHATTIAGATLDLRAETTAKLMAVASSVEVVGGTNAVIKAGAMIDVNAGVTSKLRGNTVEVTGSSLTDINGGLITIN